MSLDIDDIGRLEHNEDDPRLLEHLPRRRDRRFVAALVGALARSEGQLTEQVLVEAASSAYSIPGRMMKPEIRRKWFIEKAQSKLQITDVAQAIAAYYALVADFSLEDAARLHVAHIKGEITKEQAIVVHDSKDVSHVELINVKLPPNYAALKDFFSTVLPKQPTKVFIDKRSQNLNYNVTEERYTPPMLDATPVDIDVNKTGSKKK